jgi:hypothetical protein
MDTQRCQKSQACESFGTFVGMRLKLAPLEQSGNRWGEEHRPSLSGQTSKHFPFWSAWRTIAGYEAFI